AADPPVPETLRPVAPFFGQKRPDRLDFPPRLHRARPRGKPSRFARPHPLHRAGIAPRRYLAAPPNRRGGRNQRYAPCTCPLEQISEPFGILPTRRRQDLPFGRRHRYQQKLPVRRPFFRRFGSSGSRYGHETQSVARLLRRPPGHHAKSGKAGGFCLLNNVAAGVMHAIAEYRLKRIAVIDFDVHYGDGTAEIFKDDPRILFFNLFETDLFPFPENNGMPDGGNMVHLPLPSGTGNRTFREAVRRQWLPRLAAFKPELVLLSAGFDAHRLDESGRLNLHEADFAWLTHKIIQTASSCPGKIVSVLEGGYTLEPLAQSAAEHIRVLAGLGKSDAATAYQKTLNPTKKRFAKPKTGQVRQPTQSDRYDINAV
ncbi:LOW QUALITY PROTEIN: histone deacetylase, partial [Neisseria gonorrhoeae SK-92-679]